MRCIGLLCAENAGAVRDCAGAQFRGNIAGGTNLHLSSIYALRQLLGNDISDEEWLQCYDLIVKNMEIDKEACEKKGINIPQEIHEIAKKIRLDITATAKEEREAGHTANTAIKTNDNCC